MLNQQSLEVDVSRNDKKSLRRKTKKFKKIQIERGNMRSAKIVRISVISIGVGRVRNLILYLVFRITKNTMITQAAFGIIEVQPASASE